ncbi:MAG: hypothetical protein V8T10_09390 [Merdibacter sp.]
MILEKQSSGRGSILLPVPHGGGVRHGRAGAGFQRLRRFAHGVRSSALDQRGRLALAAAVVLRGRGQAILKANRVLIPLATLLYVGMCL